MAGPTPEHQDQVHQSVVVSINISCLSCTSAVCLLMACQVPCLVATAPSAHWAAACLVAHDRELSAHLLCALLCLHRCPSCAIDHPQVGRPCTARCARPCCSGCSATAATRRRAPLCVHAAAGKPAVLATRPSAPWQAAQRCAALRIERSGLAAQAPARCCLLLVLRGCGLRRQRVRHVAQASCQAARLECSHVCCACLGLTAGLAWRLQR